MANGYQRESVDSVGSVESAGSVASTVSDVSATSIERNQGFRPGRNYYSGTQKRNRKAGLKDGVFLASLVIGTLAFGMEIAAFSHDWSWNQVLDGEASFPALANKQHNFFKNQMFNLDPNHEQLVPIKTYLLREMYQEIFAVLMMGSFLLFFFSVVFAVWMYPNNDGVNQAFNVLTELGGVVMFVSGVLILVSDIYVDSAHIKAATILGDFIKDYPAKVNRTGIPIENEALILHQAMVLQKIEETCALSQHKHGRYSPFEAIFVEIEEEHYDLDELRVLGFCSYEKYKFAAFILCMIYTILCIASPIFIYVRTQRGLEPAKVHPIGYPLGLLPADFIPPTMEHRPTAVPPAYGYGYKQQKELERPFDPRYPPVAPRPDLAILPLKNKQRSKVESKRESELTRLEIPDNEDEVSLAGSIDEIEPTISFDSFEPGMFASYADLPPVQHDPIKAPRTSAPQRQRKEDELDEDSGGSDHKIKVVAPRPRPRPDLPELPEVPKKKKEAKTGEYVYKSPYNVRRNP